MSPLGSRRVASSTTSVTLMASGRHPEGESWNARRRLALRCHVMRRTDVFQIRIEPELRDRLARLRDERHVNVSAWARDVIAAALDRELPADLEAPKKQPLAGWRPCKLDEAGAPCSTDPMSPPSISSHRAPPRLARAGEACSRHRGLPPRAGRPSSSLGRCSPPDPPRPRLQQRRTESTRATRVVPGLAAEETDHQGRRSRRRWFT